jgi:hypothetical protein
MPSFLEISPDKLNRILGTPSAPVIVDVRTDEDFSRDPRLVPGSIRRSHADVTAWSGDSDREARRRLCRSARVGLVRSERTPLPD